MGDDNRSDGSDKGSPEQGGNQWGCWDRGGPRISRQMMAWRRAAGDLISSGALRGLGGVGFVLAITGRGSGTVTGADAKTGVGLEAGVGISSGRA